MRPGRGSRRDLFDGPVSERQTEECVGLWRAPMSSPDTVYMSHLTPHLLLGLVCLSRCSVLLWVGTHNLIIGSPGQTLKSQNKDHDYSISNMLYIQEAAGGRRTGTLSQSHTKGPYFASSDCFSSISLLWEQDQGIEVTQISKLLHQGQADVLREERQMQCPEGKVDVAVTGMMGVQPVPK